MQQRSQVHICQYSFQLYCFLLIQYWIHTCQSIKIPIDTIFSQILISTFLIIYYSVKFSKLA
jgi:hypothetical protein